VPGVVVPDDCATLDVAETCSFGYSHTVTEEEGAGDSLYNKATAAYRLPAGYDLPNLLERWDDHSVTLLHPDYTLTKSCVTEPIMPGQEAIFEIVFENTGDVDLIVVAGEELCHLGECIPAGTSFTLAVDEVRTFEVTMTAVYPSVSNSIEATATLPAWTGLPNEITHSASDSCKVRYWAFTPGFWKNHGPDAPSGHNAWLLVSDDTHPYTTTLPVGLVFEPDCDILDETPRGCNTSFYDHTLLQALSFKGGSGNSGAVEILLRAGVAALLNASFHEVQHGGTTVGGIVYYPYSSAEVIAMVEDTLCDGRAAMLALAYWLDKYNNGIEYINWDDPTQLPPYP
jgi:hypothetical protein